MREFLRNVYLSIAGTFKSPSDGIHVLNGHFVSRADISSDIFYNLLENLNRKIKFMRIEEAAELIIKKQPAKSKVLAFSFDDGFEECFTKIAPVLEEFNTNAAFFINPGFINGDESYIKNFLEKKVLTLNKNPMTWNQVIDLHKRGHIIGAHTIDHIRLTIEDEKELSFQLHACKKMIEEKTSAPCEHFAYPYGQLRDINEKALQVAKENYKFIYSGANYNQYCSFNESVINRRHFEGDWPSSHLNYFLSKKRMYGSGN